MNDCPSTYQYYSSIIEKPVSWLWYPYIPYGKITLLQGDPGEGKTTFVLNLTARLTCGGEIPDHTGFFDSQTVIYQCAEDSLEDTVKPRLLHAGADCDKVVFIHDEDQALALNDERIEDCIHRTGAKLLILDPLQAFIRQDGDMQSAVRMRTLMRQLADTAARNNCAVLLVGHLNKAAGGKSLYRGLGSIDIAAIARSVLMIGRDHNNPYIRYVFQVKSSLAPEGSAIGFIFDKEAGFQWIGACAPSEDESVPVARSQSKKEQAKDLLRVMLSAGDLKSRDVFERLGWTGISERTIRTAQKEMNITAYKKNNAWYLSYGKDDADA